VGYVGSQLWLVDDCIRLLGLEDTDYMMEIFHAIDKTEKHIYIYIYIYLTVDMIMNHSIKTALWGFRP